MPRVKRLRASAILVATLTASTLAAQDPTPSKLDVGPGLERERARLSNYQWRLKTEMKIDGTVRMSKLEDVHLGPDGGLVKKIVKFDKAMEPTPFPENDPRSRVYAPTTGTEEDRLSEIAQDLMQYYARLSPERVTEWAKNHMAELQVTAQVPNSGLAPVPEDVARLTVESRVRGAGDGWRRVIDHGALIEEGPAALPPGTRVRVRF